MTPQEKQQLKARFFGMHYGCKFISPCFSGYQISIGVYEEIENGEVHKRIKGVYGWYALELCKLILRPLSSITDSEALEYAIILDGNEADTSPASIASVKMQLRRTSDNLDGHIFKFDWLRSKNFALPFCGVDPVEAGLAILEETTNQPKGANQ